MVILGPTYQEQQLEYKIDRINATTYTRTWKGPKSVLDAIAFIEKEYTESIELKAGENNGSCVLTGRYVNGTGASGDLEQPSDTQEIDTSAVQRSIFLNKYFQDMGPEAQLLVRKIFQNQETRADAMGILSVARALAHTITAAEEILAQQAYDLYVMGAESFEDYAYVLNRTRKCSRRFSGKLELKFINTLWTTEQLHAYTGNALLFDLPDLICTPAETAKGLLPRWRMSVCRVSDVSDGSRSMVEQWQLANWSSILYDPYVPA